MGRSGRRRRFQAARGLLEPVEGRHGGSSGRSFPGPGLFVSQSDYAANMVTADWLGQLREGYGLFDEAFWELIRARFAYILLDLRTGFNTASFGAMARVVDKLVIVTPSRVEIARRRRGDRRIADAARHAGLGSRPPIMSARSSRAGFGGRSRSLCPGDLGAAEEQPQGFPVGQADHAAAKRDHRQYRTTAFTPHPSSTI